MPTGATRVRSVLAVVAGGSYGALAGGLVVAGLAVALGAPRGGGAGEIIPSPGWNAFTAFIVGLPIGFAGGAVVALRASRRWPWLVGLPIAIIGALVVVSLVADPAQWDSNFWMLAVPVLPGIAFVVWYVRRRRPR